MAQTALVIEVKAAEALVDASRELHDPVASRGIPAHITVLFPFVDPPFLDRATHGELDRIVAATQPFHFELVDSDQFSGTLWLRPDPDEPFRHLTGRIWHSFALQPPYEGAFADSQPHLTVAHAEPGAPLPLTRTPFASGCATRSRRDCQCPATLANCRSSPPTRRVSGHGSIVSGSAKFPSDQPSATTSGTRTTRERSHSPNALA